MTPMTESEMAEALARADAATPGPWDHSPGKDWNAVYNLSRVDGLPESHIGKINYLVDTRFIAAARTDLPRAIHTALALAGENAELRSRVESQVAIMHAELRRNFERSAGKVASSSMKKKDGARKTVIRIEIYTDDGKISAYVGGRRVTGLKCLHSYMIGGFNVDVDTLKGAIAEWEQDENDH